ncbi:hypothetical protein CFBP6625_23085 [Agrobacterium tumefaciens]|nr:hypothetical protein CFBP6625_23085 [Agrobacterium tumefaciens]
MSAGAQELHAGLSRIGSIPTPSFLCLSQESSRRASARREGPFQPKDLGWLDLCDRHRDEGSNGILKKPISQMLRPPDIHVQSLP